MPDLDTLDKINQDFFGSPGYTSPQVVKPILPEEATKPGPELNIPAPVVPPRASAPVRPVIERAPAPSSVPTAPPPDLDQINAQFFPAPSERVLPSPAQAQPAEPSILGELGKGVVRGGIQFGEMAGGIAAIAGAENVGKKLLSASAEIAKPFEAAVPSYTDIKGLHDALLYAAHGLGTIIPTIALSAATGGVGGFIGKGVAQRAIVKKLGEAGVARVGMKAIRDEAFRSAATTMGATAGAAASSYAMETGQIGQTQVEEGKGMNPLRALAFAVPAAMLDVFPQWALARRLGLLKAAGKEIGPIARFFEEGATGPWYSRIGKEAAKQFAMEAPTEGAQSILERLGASQNPFTQEGLSDIINSFLIGGIGGAVFGGVGGIFGKRAAPATAAPAAQSPTPTPVAPIAPIPPVESTVPGRPPAVTTATPFPPAEAVSQGPTLPQVPAVELGGAEEALTSLTEEGPDLGMIESYFGQNNKVADLITEASAFGREVKSKIVTHDEEGQQLSIKFGESRIWANLEWDEPAGKYEPVSYMDETGKERKIPVDANGNMDARFWSQLGLPIGYRQPADPTVRKIDVTRPILSKPVPIDIGTAEKKILAAKEVPGPAAVKAPDLTGSTEIPVKTPDTTVFARREPPIQKAPAAMIDGKLYIGSGTHMGLKSAMSIPPEILAKAKDIKIGWTVLVGDTDFKFVTNEELDKMEGKKSPLGRIKIQYEYPDYNADDVARIKGNHLARIFRNMPEKLALNIVGTESELPPEIQDLIGASFGKTGLKGLYDADGKRIFIIWDKIRSMRDLDETIYHEVVGHYGIAQLFGNKLRPWMNQVWEKYGAEGLADIAKAYNLDLNNPQDRYNATLEKIAQLAENHQDPTLVARFIAFIRQLLREIGLTHIQLSDAEIQIALYRSRNLVAEQALANTGARARERIGAKPFDILAKMPPVLGPVWYSQLEKTIQDKMPNAAPANQISGMLTGAGVKADETKWTGLDDFLKSREKFTKQEMLDFLKVNQVEVREVLKENLPNKNITPIEDIRLWGGATKFSQWQLPGGENYRELLLMLPSTTMETGTDVDVRRFHDLSEGLWNRMPENDKQRYRQVYREISGGQERVGFRSSHFDEPNILTHIRFNERTDAQGNRVLFIEEVQSDWHQQGREKGYGPQVRYSVQDIEDGTILQSFANRGDADAYAKQQSGTKVIEDKTLTGIPPAPFSKTWHEIAMRRMVRWAAENGFDKIAWTTGEQQAERYDLSKQIDSLGFTKNPTTVNDGLVDIWALQDNRNVMEKRVPLKDISNYVGKDLANKILMDPKQSGVFSGLDLKVGGEGMKGFYDKILLEYMNKFGKKWGAKVEETDINGSKFTVVDRETGKTVDEEGVYDAVFTTRAEAEKQVEMLSKEGYDTSVVVETDKQRLTVHSLDITPSMRDSIVTQGLPLFRKEMEAEAATGPDKYLYRLDTLPSDASESYNLSRWALWNMARKGREEGFSRIGEGGTATPITLKKPFSKWFDEILGLPNWIAMKYPNAKPVFNVEMDRLDRNNANRLALLTDPGTGTGDNPFVKVRTSPNVAKLVVWSDINNTYLSSDQALQDQATLMGLGTLTAEELAGYHGWKKGMDQAVQFQISELKDIFLSIYSDRSWGQQLSGIMNGSIDPNTVVFPDTPDGQEFKAALAATQVKFQEIGTLQEKLQALNFYTPRTRGTGDYVIRVYSTETDAEGNPARYQVWRLNATDPTKAEKQRILLSHNPDFAGMEIVKSYEPGASEAIYDRFDPAAMKGFLDIALDRAERKQLMTAAEADTLFTAVTKSMADEVMARGFRETHLRRMGGTERVIGGYQTENLGEVFYKYLAGVSGSMAKLRASHDFYKALSNNIDASTEPGLFDYWSRYIRDMLRNPDSVDRKINQWKTLPFAWYLTSNLRMVVAQFIQNYMTAAPILSRYVKEWGISGPGGTRRIEKAMRDVVNSKINLGTGISEEESQMLNQAYLQGETAARQIQEMKGRMEGGWVGQSLNKVMEVAATPFSGMESINRQSALLAMFRLAREHGMPYEEAYGQAREFVRSAHYAYGRSNMPQLLREGTTFSKIAGLGYVFRSFTHNYILSMIHYARTSDGKLSLDVIGRSLAFMAIVGGAAAVPFMDDLLDQLEKLTGNNYRTKMRQALKGVGGDMLAEVGMQGVPALIAGFDISGSIKIGIPGTGGAEKNIYGVWGGLRDKGITALNAVLEGEAWRAMEAALPTGLESPMKAYRQATKGVTTSKGKALLGKEGEQIKLTTGEALLQAASLRPARIAEVSSERRVEANILQHYSDKRSKIYERLRRANTPAEYNSLIRDVEHFNMDIQRYGGVIAPISMKSLKQALKPETDYMKYTARTGS